jgi:hypothetical protein
MRKYYNHENSSKVIWPHEEYNPIHADCFMQSVLISGKGFTSNAENAFINKVAHSMEDLLNYTYEDAENALHESRMWIQSFFANPKPGELPTKKLFQAFFDVGIELAEINKYNPNVLNNKLQNLRDCCASHGEIDTFGDNFQNGMISELAELWKMGNDWSKRLPMYISKSDYDEKNIIGYWGIFSYSNHNPLEDYLRILYAIGTYSFCHGFGDNNEIFPVPSIHASNPKRDRVFEGHPKADKESQEIIDFLLEADLDFSFKLKKQETSKEECIKNISYNVVSNWFHTKVETLHGIPDRNEPRFYASIANLEAFVNIVTTLPDSPSDKTWLQKIYNVLLEAAEHNKADSRGIYQNVATKLEEIREAWGIKDDIKLSGIIDNPEIPADYDY